MTQALKKEWWIFHRANPRIWQLFKDFTWKAIRAGHAHYSSKAIFEVIRWETTVLTQSEDDFKINNNHTPYYARLFIHENPNYGDFFHLREVNKGDQDG